jgi:alpha-ketoglutarate-dependent taurine dioxygenase
MGSRITQRSLTPFGVDIIVDAEVPGDLHEADHAELRGLYERHGLVVLRNLRLTMDAQIDLCSIFGPALPLGHPENYIVSNVHPDGFLGAQELLFHNDVPFVRMPYLGGSLHALEVDAGVSPTRFASGYLAYEHLPEELRQRIDALNAIHVRKRKDDRRTRLTDVEPGDPIAVHPVVRRHPRTGRTYLFVSQDMTGTIIGLDESESDALLEELFSHLYAPATIYDHAWQQGDIVIWDNLAVQHARYATSSGTRTLQRVTIAEMGRYDQCPGDLPSFEQLKTANRGAAFEKSGSASPVGAT